MERIRQRDGVIYRCKKDEKILAELMDSGEVIIYGNCQHYKWVSVSSQCYYNHIPRCGRSLIRWLKENQLLKLESSGTVNILVQNQS